MNRQLVAEIVARLFTAAGRRASELDYDVWSNALDDVRDDLAEEATLIIIREQDLREHPPTPAGFRQVTRALADRRPPLEEYDDRALAPGVDAVRSGGWRVERRCGECDGDGYIEVEQAGSHIAVKPCLACNRTGEGNDLPSRVTPPDEARERLAELRRILHERPILKKVPDVYPLPHVTYGERDFCPEEDHSKCGSGPIHVPEEG